MTVVVSDTSPIRALEHLGILPALGRVFDQVLIPPAVERELHQPPSALRAVDLKRHAFVRVQSPRNRDRVVQLHEALDIGEAEAIALALEVEASALLIDERAGRAAAAALGLAVVGTLGILLRLKQLGFIDALRPGLERLQEELGFFISETLRREILERAGES
jgi:hypothetical protein